MYFVERLYKQIEDTTWKYGVYTFEDRIAALKMYYKLLAADIDDESKASSTLVFMDLNANVFMRKRFDHIKPIEPLIELNTETE